LRLATFTYCHIGKLQRNKLPTLMKAKTQIALAGTSQQMVQLHRFMIKFRVITAFIILSVK